MTASDAMGLEVTLPLPPPSLVIRLLVPGAAVLPALEPICDQYVTLATVGVPLAASVPHLPALTTLLLGTWWLSFVEVGASAPLQSSSVVPSRALTGWSEQGSEASVGLPTAHPAHPYSIISLHLTAATGL